MFNLTTINQYDAQKSSINNINFITSINFFYHPCPNQPTPFVIQV